MEGVAGRQQQHVADVGPLEDELDAALLSDIPDMQNTGEEDQASAATEEDLGAPDEVEMMEDALFDPPERGLVGDGVAADPEPKADSTSIMAPMVAAGSVQPPGANSSGGLSPPPPPPPPPEDVAAAARGAATCVLFVPGGKVVYYGGRHQNMVAICENLSHGRCVKTKTVKGSARQTQAARSQGRPLGYLAAWLARGAALDSKEDHWGSEGQPTLEERVAARANVKELGGADASGLVAAERPKRDGEVSEPEEAP